MPPAATGRAGLPLAPSGVQKRDNPLGYQPGTDHDSLIQIKDKAPHFGQSRHITRLVVNAACQGSSCWPGRLLAFPLYQWVSILSRSTEPAFKRIFSSPRSFMSRQQETSRRCVQSRRIKYGNSPPDTHP